MVPSVNSFERIPSYLLNDSGTLGAVAVDLSGFEIHWFQWRKCKKKSMTLDYFANKHEK